MYIYIYDKNAYICVNLNKIYPRDLRGSRLLKRCYAQYFKGTVIVKEEENIVFDRIISLDGNYLIDVLNIQIFVYVSFCITFLLFSTNIVVIQYFIYDKTNDSQEIT